ncbi:hypothetical protein MRB53_036852 [Persea americana]|nr:hypothetical protein MRB53_036852 [Persea americana]
MTRSGKRVGARSIVRCDKRRRQCRFVMKVSMFHGQKGMSGDTGSTISPTRPKRSTSPLVELRDKDNHLHLRAQQRSNACESSVYRAFHVTSTMKIRSGQWTCLKCLPFLLWTSS